MHDDLLTLLKKQGAMIDNQTIDFDHTQINLNETPLISLLSDFAVLMVEGDDRHSFLNGQFTNDLSLIKKPAAQLSAWCNPNGQVITNFLIINTNSSYLLIFKKEQKEIIQKKLNLFVLRAKVNIKDVSDTFVLIGIKNIADLSVLIPNTPLHPGKITTYEGLTMICHPDHSGRYLMIGDNDVLIHKLSKLKSHVTLCDNPIWNLLDIFAGLPWISLTTQEQFLPQVLNLDTLKGLSYRKGCYPGQEIIARLHYRGKVKYRLQLIKSKKPFSCGDNIHLQNLNNKIGTIINVERLPDAPFYGLAVIELDKLDERLFSNNEEIMRIKRPASIQGNTLPDMGICK